MEVSSQFCYLNPNLFNGSHTMIVLDVMSDFKVYILYNWFHSRKSIQSAVRVLNNFKSNDSSVFTFSVG